MGTTMKNHTPTRSPLVATARVLLALVSLLGATVAAAASDGVWTVDLEPIVMELHGHDQHVLTVHEIDLDSSPTVDSSSAVTLDTESGPAYRGEIRYLRGKWGLGIGFLWFNTSQALDPLTAAAGGEGERVVFEVPDREFVSTSPADVLFYERLEDTDLALWTADLYAIRTLSQGEKSALHLLFGLRSGDFDNDYRAVVGIEGSGGARFDASSNYGLMMGPLLGLTGQIQLGRNWLEGHLGQSVLLGEAELGSMIRDFSGPFGDEPAYFAQESIRADLDVAIPVSELRLRWRYAFSRSVALGLGVDVSTWWDVSVPPGAVPIPGGAGVLHENTLVLFGLSGGLTLTF